MGNKKPPFSENDLLQDYSEHREEGSDATEIDSYAAHKRRQLIVAELLISGYPQFSKQYYKLLNCGNNLHYWHFERVDKWRLKDGLTCQQHLLCGGCARRRGIRQSFAYGQKVKYLLQENPQLTPVLITRTIRNQESLADSWLQLNSAHKKLTKRRRNSLSVSITSRGARTKDSPMKDLAGGAGTYEFKRGKGSRTWHPHSHEIALLEPGHTFNERVDRFKVRGPDGKFSQWAEKVYYVPTLFHEALSAEWFEVTGDSFIVDVRAIDIASKESYVGGLLEVFSYTLKSSSLSPEDQIHAYKRLCRNGRARRLIYSYGNLRGVNVPETDMGITKDELLWETYVDKFFAYDHGQGVYVYDQYHSARETKLYIPVSSGSLSGAHEQGSQWGTLDKDIKNAL